MAGSRRKRQDSDSEGDTEGEDEQLKRVSKGKRRVRESFIEGNDIAPGPSRTSAIDLNDDTAEKRRRRKSAKQSVAFLKPLDEEEQEEAKAARERRGLEESPERNATGPSGPRTPKVSALARATQLNTVAETPVPAVSLDVMSSNFEEWMKMATDNKINANNAWNFALIDYFQDMSLLRNERDNSINFQKASFTLDGCVKIWTSRVDSVGTETGKLLSNLADEVRGLESREEDGEPGEDGEGKAKKAKAHRPEATLAKSLTQLQVKKLELEFTVDPLFKKTCADFDEGGAMGLLMNHLGVDEKLRVVFDAGDSRLEDFGEVPEEVISLPVDLSELRDKFVPSLDEIRHKSITQSLGDFRFSSDFTGDFSVLQNFGSQYEDMNDGASSAGGDDAAPGFNDDVFGDPPAADDMQAEDFFTGDQAIDEPGASYEAFNAGTGEDRVGPLGPVENFDPRRLPNERDLVMAMTEDGDEMLDYFDSTVMKNWAGPQHWKLRRAIKKAENAEPGATMKTKKEKQAFEIDFSPEASRSSKELFAPANRSTILLPAATGAAAPASSSGRRKTKKVKVKRDDHLLPDDMHFSSAQLLRLFLKPKFTDWRNYSAFEFYVDDDDNITVVGENGDGEIDENFWANAVANGNNQEGGEEDGDSAGNIPFNTQFFHDDYDDGPGFDDDDIDGPGGTSRILEEDDLLSATQGQLKRTRPEFVNYAKKAKRVDVRKLKENIWKGLSIVTDHKSTEEVEEEEDEDRPAPTDPSEARQFDTVIQDLQTAYPKDKMEEISTSFCFICLLHLANEQGLKLEVGANQTKAKEAEVEEDDPEAAKRVGNIWGLKVYRDPNATQSA
ncbi:hypothetical protein FRC02_001817 [Tulasnella sp. 418]|nr:hypothetical protein FRC02_001817 [Tulasnella sp. 418]